MDTLTLRRRLIKIVLWTWGAWLVAGNLFLATSIGQKLIAPHPERFTIRWRTAWTVIPGLAHVRDLEIQQHSRDTVWNLKVDRAVTAVNILALPFKTFHAILPRTTGVECRLEAASTTMPPSTKTKPGFRIWLSGASVKDIRFLDFFGIRIEGDVLQVRGGFDSTARGPMAIPGARVLLKEGRITIDSVPLTTDLALDCRARIDKHLKIDRENSGIFQFISGKFKMSGDLADLRFIDSLVRSVSWMKVHGGAGTLDGELEIKRGSLQATSRLNIDTSAFTFDFLDYSATGTGRVVIAGREPDDRGNTKLDFDFDDFALGYSDSETPHVEGHSLSVSLIGNLGEMTEPGGLVEVTFDLPESDVPDLRVFNRYFKQTTPLNILSGAGSIATHLRIATGTQAGEGFIEVKANGISADLKGKEIVADLETHTVINVVDLKERNFKVAGSTIKISNAGVAIPNEKEQNEAPPRDWWCNIDINDGTILLKKPVTLDVDLTLTAYDVSPLLALMSKTQKSADRRDKLLGIHDFGGSTHLAMGNGVTHIKDLHFEGGRAEILGNLCLQNPGSKGAIYIGYGILSLSVEIIGEDNKNHIFGPRKWYDKYIGEFSCN